MGKMRAVKDGLPAPMEKLKINRASLDGLSQKFLTPLLSWSLRRTF